jgi:hypothetical protein
MPVSERFSSNRTTPGVADLFSSTVIGWPMARRTIPPAA